MMSIKDCLYAVEKRFLHVHGKLLILSGLNQAKSSCRQGSMRLHSGINASHEKEELNLPEFLQRDKNLFDETLSFERFNDDDTTSPVLTDFSSLTEEHQTALQKFSKTLQSFVAMRLWWAALKRRRKARNPKSRKSTRQTRTVENPILEIVRYGVSGQTFVLLTKKKVSEQMEVASAPTYASILKRGNQGQPAKCLLFQIRQLCDVEGMTEPKLMIAPGTKGLKAQFCDRL